MTAFPHPSFKPKEPIRFVEKNQKMGVVNIQGQIIIPIEYDVLMLTKDYFLAVKNDKYGFISPQNQVIIPFEYDYIDFFYEGLALVKKNEKFGFINQKGELVIDIKYDEAREFHEGLANVRVGVY